MKRSLILITALSLGILASCKEEDAAEETASAAAAAAADSYPLTTCVVSGEPLDSMGGPEVITYEGQTVKFCCGGCEDDFVADPATYLAKIEAARK